VFRAEARASVHEKDVVGQVPQTRAQEESLHQEQPSVLTVVGLRAIIALLTIFDRNEQTVKNASRPGPPEIPTRRDAPVSYVHSPVYAKTKKCPK